MLVSQPKEHNPLCNIYTCDYEIQHLSLNDAQKTTTDTPGADIDPLVQDDILYWRSVTPQCRDCEHDITIILKNLTSREQKEVVKIQNVSANLPDLTAQYPLVAFVVFDEETLNQIYIHNISSGATIPLPVNETKPAQRVDLLYDLVLEGDKLWYHHWRVRGGKYVAQTRWINITSNETGTLNPPGGLGSKGWGVHLSKTPRGILFAADTANGSTLWHYDGEYHPLAHSEHLVRHPTWLNGQIFYIEQAPQKQDLIALDIRTGEKVVLESFRRSIHTLKGSSTTLAWTQYIPSNYQISILNLPE